jgi:undecaprenyl-diphosphatase
MFAGNSNTAYTGASTSSRDACSTVFLAANEISLNVSILSPENTTYTTSDIPLKFTANASASWIGYSLDGQANVSTVGNMTLTNLAEGSHYIVVYSNDTAGRMISSQTVYFTIRHLSIPEIAFLGALQGLTEWLPVSSTAHLIMAEHFLGFPAIPPLDIILHVGTLVVVVFYFRKEVKNILSALAHLDFKSEHGQLIPLIIVATIPTGIIGLLYVKFLEDTLQTLLAIGITFLVGVAILYTSRIGKENKDTLTYMIAFIMGSAQGLAIFPGLSRSGITISTALLLGLKREKAFKFSFLLSIPAIIGDLAVEAYKQRGQLAAQGIGTIELLVGVMIAMVAGYVAIKLVSKVLSSKKFHYFAIYTLLLGITLIALALSGF